VFDGGSGATDTTLMASEAAEAPVRIARMLDANAATFAQIGARLRAAPPAVVVTCARGSSDHAATYAKYLIEAMVGIPTAHAAPAIASVYGARSVPSDRLCLAISQSGRSPDLLAVAQQQKRAGAFVVAIVNDGASPLAGIADAVVELGVGPERSVAATKSYLASLAAIAALVTEWTGDAPLRTATAALPAALEDARARDWSVAVGPLERTSNLFVIGRGYGLAAAREAALKFKETCAIHAEAFSAAEVRHGPMAIVAPGFAVLALAGSDRAGDSVLAVAAEFRARGAAVLIADAGGAGDLPACRAHPAIEPMLMIQSFYAMVEALARARGLNPDAPPHLNKVTETL
jgi:glutamine---fructose-6-phosphate transaminase (isomerizing)